jgi:hypothetical protein
MISPMSDFVVTRQSRKGKTLFLIDRRKRQDRWWSFHLDDALITSHDSATEAAKRLKFSKPAVMNLKIAIKIVENRFHDEIEDSIHPQDPTALGQE